MMWYYLHDEADVHGESLHSMEAGDEGDGEEALGIHLSPQEEVSLQVVEAEVVLTGEKATGYISWSSTFPLIGNHLRIRTMSSPRDGSNESYNNSYNNNCITPVKTAVFCPVGVEKPSKVIQQWLQLHKCEDLLLPAYCFMSLLDPLWDFSLYWIIQLLLNWVSLILDPHKI